MQYSRVVRDGRGGRGLGLVVGRRGRGPGVGRGLHALPARRHEPARARAGGGRVQRDAVDVLVHWGGERLLGDLSWNCISPRLEREGVYLNFS